MTSAWHNLRWNLAYWLSSTGSRLGRYIPAGFWYFMARPVVAVCYLVMARERKTLTRNLARVVGEEAAPAAARRVFYNFARYVIDFYQLPRLDKKVLRDRMDFHDWQPLNAALADGGGIFVTMHLGQAELGAGALSAYGHQVNAVTEALSHPRMNEFIQGLRRDLGMKVISANKARMGVLRSLSRGETLAMMVDVVEPGDGIMVDFFGAPAEFSSAPARIALRTGARIMPGVVARSPQNHQRLMPLIDFGLSWEPSGDEETDVRNVTQAVATSLESYVRQYPDQWFAFHPVWAPGSAEAPAQPERGRWKHWALALAVRTASLLPKPAAYAVARVAGDAAFRWRHGARSDVLDNMRHVLGPDASAEVISNAAREAFRNVARYYVDLVRLKHTNMEADIGKSIRLHGFDILQSHLARGQGAVVATAHFGNPEVAVQVGAVLGVDILVLAEPLQPPAFADMMRRLRSAFGPRYEDVSFSTVVEAMRHLKSGGCLAITVDRDIQQKGAPLPFFGAVTRMPLGAVELAARTGAALIPAYCRRSGNGFDIYFEEPLPLVNSGRTKEDALANARALLERAEERIASDPGQWMVLERIWKPVHVAIPEPKPKPVASSAG